MNDAQYKLPPSSGHVCGVLNRSLDMLVFPDSNPLAGPIDSQLRGFFSE